LLERAMEIPGLSLEVGVLLVDYYIDRNATARNADEITSQSLGARPPLAMGIWGNPEVLASPETRRYLSLCPCERLWAVVQRGLCRNFGPSTRGRSCRLIPLMSSGP
jgi:hypothetical protein